MLCLDVEPVSLVVNAVAVSTEPAKLWSPASVCGLSTPPVDMIDTSVHSRPTSQQGKVRAARQVRVG